MTQITFELGDHPHETGVYVNPDFRWGLKEIAEEIIKLGEDEFRKQYCYYRSRTQNGGQSEIFDKYQDDYRTVKSGTVRSSSGSSIVNTASGPRRNTYAITIGDKHITSDANKVQMVYKMLSYLIEKEGYTPESLNKLYEARYFNYPLLKSFERNMDKDQMKESLGKDATRFSLKYIIETDGKFWVPCSQWIPKNTDLFISDMLQFNGIIEDKITITNT
jgi:hypothetical protein